MKAFLLKVFEGRIISPWWILLIDLMLSANAYLIAFILRLNFQVDSYSVLQLLRGGAWILLVYLAFFLFFGSYRGVIRHSNYTELRLVVISSFSAFSFLLLFQSITPLFFEWIDIPRLVLIFHFTATVFFCLGFRMLVRETYAFLTRKNATVNAVIYGAGDLGLITLEAIQNDKFNQINVVCFADDKPSMNKLILHGIPVCSWKHVVATGRQKGIEEVILTISSVPIHKKQEIASTCLELGWKLKVMPSVENWVNGVSNTKQIREVRIEDLLGRDEIKLNLKNISNGLSGKTILVSGAAGSIGSEIVRQLLRFPVKKILLVDIAESALYDLQQELLLKHYDGPFEIVLADITNRFRMEQVFIKHRPEIVFNAAAYKHVPLMEENPFEAIRVNVGGTKMLADLSVKNGVQKFVMVSTDKAVNPSNVMGASKRVCEMYVQALSQQPNQSTSFITTRFGNVLGSNGSVVPLFKRQIEQGGPVTVTHPEITRFFMTIPEACQLVLEAGFMGNGGEIFVFDMGEPVRIADLAKEMIQLAGLKLDEDIEIKYTGLRPGEKLYEELLASKETTLPTHHDKIMIAQVRKQDFERINKSISDLLFALQEEPDEELVAKMKDMVPEFVSMNSQFVKLDEIKV